MSKVALDGKALNFESSDKLVLTDGSTTYATLDLKSGEGSTSATFEGTISADAAGKTIYATIGTELSGVASSSASLADVVHSS